MFYKFLLLFILAILVLTSMCGCRKPDKIKPFVYKEHNLNFTEKHSYYGARFIWEM